jgi:hypothetical protein
MRRLPPLLAALTLVGLVAPLPAAPPLLRVKASPAVAPCVAAAVLEYERATGRRLALQTAPIGTPDSAEGADVLVAADREFVRVIESGATDPGLEVDVARIPWVLSGAGAGADVHAVGRRGATVRTLDGVVAREAWRRLARDGFAPGRIERQPEGPVRLAPGEIAIVPLSIAPAGPVSALDVPPLLARAVGVRGSARAEAARAFLEFLTAERGNAAFRACGRPEPE